MTSSLGWARAWVIARPDTEPALRQGAWYPVVSQGTAFVVLEIRSQRVAVPHHLVEIRDQQPARFTVVYRAEDDPNPARETKLDLGRKYAVCPTCGVRVKLTGEPQELTCPVCAHTGAVAWWETG